MTALDNQVDVQTGTVRAKARYTNDKMALFPSQFVNVRLELGNITGAVLVPVTALRHSNNGDFVYVLKADKTVTVRMVTRGQATTDMVEIRAGLEAGEQVITEGADRLKEGAKVTLAGDKPAMGAGGAGANGERRHRRQHADGAASAPAASAAASAPAPAPAPATAPAKGAAQ
ncbi:Multidrug resistance protein MdtA precursor [compost metagenome]